MSITIKKSKAVVYGLLVDDMQDGHAYESSCGHIFIANRYDDVVAFDLSGTQVISADDVGTYREINITVTVDE